ncbi:hypothetical protein GX51_05253 [Blastomyces parvus]|uniref:Uncharacterized protein n=1 Tax=Blastomyces parvus TaxID=2060905 RepID=A0A2B7WXB2_9EURO|nr:hypothetical protein GX51_05253 [Blastomyces parvus]
MTLRLTVEHRSWFSSSVRRITRESTFVPDPNSSRNRDQGYKNTKGLAGIKTGELSIEIQTICGHGVIKISGAAVVALLASTTTALDWGCNRPGGGGHDTLKKVHSQFNKLFGESRLNIAPNQCYVAKCHDHYFGVCNRSSYTQLERSGDRNVARNTDPKSGSFCGLTPSRSGGASYIKYIYSRVKDVSFSGPNNSIRVC